MHALALLQAPLGMTEGQTHWLIAFTLLTAIAVLIQAIALGAIAFMAVKLLKQISDMTDVLKQKVYPLLDTARDVVNDTVPKFKRVTTNIADTSDVYRSKLAEIDSLISDATSRARRQTERVDGMVANTLTSMGHVSGAVQHAVMAPVRQAASLIQQVRSRVEDIATRLNRGSAGVAQAASRRAARAAASSRGTTSTGSVREVPKPVAFEGETIYTGLADDYHA